MGKRLKRNMIFAGIAVTIFYVICFGYLEIYQFEEWVYSDFIKSLLGVFMSAGAIAIITGILLVFQATIHSEQEKNKEIFKEKINLYKSIIIEMEQISRDKKISEEEGNKLVSLRANVQLLSNPETYEKFVNFLNNIQVDGSDNLSDEYNSLLIDFISAASKDLEIKNAVTQNKEQEQRLRIDKKSKEVLNTKYAKTFFENVEQFKKGNPYYKNQSELIDYIDEKMNKEYQGVNVDRSKNNITFYHGESKNKGSFCIFEIYRKTQINLLTLRDHKINYNPPTKDVFPNLVVDITLYRGVKKWQEAIIKSKEELDSLEDVIKRSYEIIQNNEPIC